MLQHKEHVYPDIFLAGAPKAGTTSLFDLLNEHPKIQGANNKEPAFFMDKDSPHNQANLPNATESYLSFYEPYQPEALHLDGSTQTMYQRGFAKQLKASGLRPKFIVLLRDPAERIYSSFSYTANNLASIQGIGFDEYQEMLLSNRLEVLRPYCKNERAFYSMSHELEFSKYHEFLKIWEDVLGKEQMKILSFEQLKSNPEHLWYEVLDFLGLAQIPLPKSIGRSNPTRMIRNPKTHYFLHQLYERIGYRVPFAKSLKSLYGSLQYNSDQRSSDSISLDQLTEYFQPWNKKLADDFSVDISQWRS